MPAKPLTDGLADLPRSTAATRDANLIRAATDLYVQDAVHDRDQSRRFEELAVHFLPKIALADRAYVAERLADRRDAPPAVIRLLARDAIEVASPVLATSPMLDTLTLLSTIAATGPDHHRAIARRKDLPEQVRRGLRLTGDVEVLRTIGGETAAVPALAEPVRPERPVRQANGPLPDTHRDGRMFLTLTRRDRLAVLVDYTTRPAAPTPAGGTQRLDRAFRSILGAAKIVGYARAGQREQLIAAVAEGLDLAPDFVRSCLDDATGEAMAVLLKALRLETAQAQQVFLLASPAGRDARLFFPLADLYAGMEASVAEAVADAWRAQAVGRKPAHQPYIASEPQPRPLPQAARAVPPPPAKTAEDKERAWREAWRKA